MSQVEKFPFPKNPKSKLVLIIVGITLICFITTSIIFGMKLKSSQILNDEKPNFGEIEVVQKSISGMHFIAKFQVCSCLSNKI